MPRYFVTWAMDYRRRATVALIGAVAIAAGLILYAFFRPVRIPLIPAGLHFAAATSHTPAVLGVDCVVQNQSIRTRNGNNCNYSLDPGTTLTLMAVPEREHARFVGWQGCDSYPSPTECTVTMNSQPRTVTAQFTGG
jgi:hypothetical protein